MYKLHFGKIKKIAYALYKDQWLREHVSKNTLLETRREYALAIINDDIASEASFEGYVNEFGFNGGQIFVSYDEFLNAEFKDDDYMRKLLKKPELIDTYNYYMHRDEWLEKYEAQERKCGDLSKLTPAEITKI